MRRDRMAANRRRFAVENPFPSAEYQQHLKLPEAPRDRSFPAYCDGAAAAAAVEVCARDAAVAAMWQSSGVACAHESVIDDRDDRESAVVSFEKISKALMKSPSLYQESGISLVYRGAYRKFGLRSNL